MLCKCIKSCCSYAVGRTTRRHPAISSRIFFPLHLFSPRSCHRLSTAEHRLSMLFFSQENIFLKLGMLNLSLLVTNSKTIHIQPENCKYYDILVDFKNQTRTTR